MANLFLNLIYSLTAGLSSVVSRMQNFLGALSMEGIGVSGGNFVTGAKNFMNLVFWEIEKFILGILSVLEYIAYEFLGIGQGVDNYANFATKNNLTSTYTRTFKAVAVVAIILMIVFTIFAPIYWAGFEPFTIWLCIACGIGGAILELLMEVIFSPLGYRVVKAWKRENVGSQYLEAHPEVEE